MWRDLYYDTRPYWGHTLMGMCIGLLAAEVALTLIASYFGATGELFSVLTWWVLGLFVAAVTFGAIGMVIFMGPWDRQEYFARHALRRSESL